MPFTPIHMGPGILVKAFLQGGFSLMVFGWAQIVMDVQPLVVLVTGQGHLHGFSHTYTGAALLGAFSALSGKYLSEYALKTVSVSRNENFKISWLVAATSAFTGTFSHVVLDAIMHADVQPYYPFSVENGLFGLTSISVLHRFCLFAAVVGAILFFTVQFAARKYNRGVGKGARKTRVPHP